MYKSFELNSRKHAHSFEHSFPNSTNIYEATTHTTLYINLCILKQKVLKLGLKKSSTR